MKPRSLSRNNITRRFRRNYRRAVKDNPYLKNIIQQNPELEKHSVLLNQMMDHSYLQGYKFVQQIMELAFREFSKSQTSRPQTVRYELVQTNYSPFLSQDIPIFLAPEIMKDFQPNKISYSD
jgi:hypothetical protein